MSYDNLPPEGENLHPETLLGFLTDEDEALLESICRWASTVSDIQSLSVERVTPRRDAHIMRIFFRA